MSTTTKSIRLGSLCTGYGGLDLAAEEFLGARTIWCAEFEEAPSRVIEARFPGVPNMHDVKRIPWHIMAPIDALTAGYPCQPFSLAGARKGEEDPRHLWPSIAEGIRIMRPRHVLLENVRGHLSLGFDQVLHDLNALGYAVVWRILSAAAVGACHRRERLFIYAQPVEFVAAQRGPVLAIAGADGWLEAEADLFGERMMWTEQLPVSGVMRAGELRAVTLHQPPLNLTLLPTPDAYQGSRGGSQDPEKRKAGGHTVSLADVVEKGMVMLPTPTTMEPHSSGGSTPSNVTLTDAIVRTEMGTIPNPRLLPTPQASDAVFSATARTGGRPVEKSTKLATQMALLQTPTAALAGGVQTLERQVGGRWAHENTGSGWGKYGVAVERHEAMLGRTAPAPTQRNSKDNPELAPAFVEWMMCLEPGRVTDLDLWAHISPRKAREVQLKMLGNGVVPPQALAAYRSLAAITAVHEVAA